MKEEKLKKFIMEWGVRGYISIFLIGFCSFILVYSFTMSMEGAISTTLFLWVLSISIFWNYFFKIGDDYCRKAKTIQPLKGRKIDNIFIGIAFVFLVLTGALIGALLCINLIGRNYFSFVIGGGLGGGLILKVYYYFVIQKMEIKSNTTS
jgi:hypothetical protein